MDFFFFFLLFWKYVKYQVISLNGIDAAANFQNYFF